MNKTLHAIVLILFGTACWFMSLMLKLPMMVQNMAAKLTPPGQSVLPAFTRLCMTVGPILLAIFAAAALGYCIYIWVRKGERQAPWIGFLATTMSAVVLVVLPIVVAIYLPLVDFLNRSAALK
jgi:hypothetical protein